MKRQLESALRENAVLKKAKQNPDALVVVSKVAREQVEFVLTHEGQIKELSSRLTWLQERIKFLDNKVEPGPRHKGQFP